MSQPEENGRAEQHFKDPPLTAKIPVKPNVQVFEFQNAYIRAFLMGSLKGSLCD